mgnify:CR=1 FL=1
MGDNSFHTTVESLFKGMDSFITTKTVVGDAIHIGDTIILPLVDVSFGVAAGAFSQEKKNNGAGGMGGKITPSAVLVIQNGTTKLVNIKNQDGLTKVLDMVPDFVNKFTSKGEKENVVEESEDDSVAKKTAAKKAPAKKTTAKKAEVKTEMFLQFAGKEYTEKEIFQKVKDVWTKVLKNKVGDLKDVKIYLKPEDSAAYYVINGETTGRVEL